VRRALGWSAALLLLLGGGALATAYLVLLAVLDDRVATATDYGTLAAFGLACVCAGGLLLALLIERAGRPWLRTIRTPPLWVGVLVFVAAVAPGFLTYLTDYAALVAPLLVIAALIGLALTIGNLLTRWTPGRTVDARVVLVSGVWGMTGAVALTLALQVTAVIAMLAGLAGGLGLADPELLEGTGLRNTLEDFAEDPTSGAMEDLLNTPTVAFGMLGMIAVIAPLSEELTKALGAFVAVSGRRFTLYNAFLGGALGGLGFALVENVGYVLADPLSWPQVMLLRAPVAMIHVAAASLVAVGWSLQRTRGGFALLWFYLVAVLVHGGWNALFGAFLLVGSGSLDGSEPSNAAALTSLLLIGAMGALFVGSCVWVLLNARRLGAALVPSVRALRTEPVSLVTSGAS
jgi:hypothetical protein